MRRAHEVHAGPARLQVGCGGAGFQLVGHHLGDRQLGQRLGERFLQAVGQRDASHGAVEEQRLGLAIGCALELRHGRRIGAQGRQLLQQRGRRLAVGRQGHGHRHQLLQHAAVGRLGQHAGDVRRQPPRRGERRHGRSAGARPCGLQAVARPAGEGLAQLLQRLGRQLFDEQFDQQVLHVFISGRLLLRSAPLRQHFVGPGLRRHREAQPRAAVEVALRHRPRQVADAADVGGALGHADRAARVQQVEAVRRPSAAARRRAARAAGPSGACSAARARNALSRKSTSLCSKL
jgi:hypothetical protein